MTRPTKELMAPWHPHGLVIALQFWRGDEAETIRLARLLADIEPRRREDCALYFCCDGSTMPSARMLQVQQYCGDKFPVGSVQLEIAGNGYPSGPNVLWSGVMQHLYGEWLVGRLMFESVATLESDGVPLRRTWIQDMIDAHRTTIEAGLLVTGDVRQRSSAVPHPNGNLIAHLSVASIRELHQTPPSRPWDMFHAVTLRRLTRHDSVIRSEHRSSGWSRESLESISKETAWLHGCRDETAFDFARGLR